MPVALSDPEFAAALAEARAEGRRQGLEEAAKVAPKLKRGSLIDYEEGWNCGIQAFSKDIRSLATNPPETQKPETGESDHGQS